MPRISTGPFGATKEFVCDDCGTAFARKCDLARHEKSHDPDAERFVCPLKDCNYAALQKSNVVTHINAIHTQNRRYKCRFDPLCLKSYVDPSARIRHEKKRHDHFHKLLQDANKISSHGKAGIDGPLVSGVPDVATSQSESLDCAAVRNTPSIEGEVLRQTEPIQKPATIPSSPYSLSPVTASFNDLRLRDLQPKSPASAERPNLPGVQDVMGQCSDHSASLTATRGLFSSRILPPLPDLPARHPGKYADANASPSPIFALYPYSSSLAYGVHGNFLTSQLPLDSRSNRTLSHTEETKVFKGGKEYLVSFRVSITENKI